MRELEQLYQAMLPRMDAIADYLNQFPLEELSASARHLLNLALSFIEVSLAVELFHEPDDARALPPRKIPNNRVAGRLVSLLALSFSPTRRPPCRSRR